MRPNANEYRMPCLWTVLLLALFIAIPAMSEASTVSGSYTTDLFGSVEDPQGGGVADASVALLPVHRTAALSSAVVKAKCPLLLYERKKCGERTCSLWSCSI